MIIGLTGGLATGKSTVEKYIEQYLGIEVIDCDKVAAASLENPIVQKEILQEFGKEVFLSETCINKSALASIVFNNLNAKKKLEEIIHPQVISFVEHSIQKARLENRNLIISAPLLFEAGIDKLCDTVITVECGKTIQLLFAVERGMKKEDALARINNQLTPETRIFNANYIIWNISDKEELKSKTCIILEKIIKNEQ